MLRKRVIFTLIYNHGYFTQSRNFRLQRVGDYQWLKQNYQFHKIAFSLDELIVLNASKTSKSIENFSTILNTLRKNIFLPISAGGGIRSLKDANILFQNGADKLVLNTVLFTNPDLVLKLVNQYGSQSIIASIDYKISNNNYFTYIENGEKKIPFSLNEYISHVENLGVGEIYLNSIDRDGTGFGYDLQTIHLIQKKIHVPLIIAGGAGNEKHLIEGLQTEDVNAVATANLFNFIGNGLPNAREEMLRLGINIAVW